MSRRLATPARREWNTLINTTYVRLPYPSKNLVGRVVSREAMTTLSWLLSYSETDQSKAEAGTKNPFILNWNYSLNPFIVHQ